MLLVLSSKYLLKVLNNQNNFNELQLNRICAKEKKNETFSERDRFFVCSDLRLRIKKITNKSKIENQNLKWFQELNTISNNNLVLY